MPVSGEAEVRAAVHRAWTQVIPGAELDEGLTWQEAGVDSLKSLQLLLLVEKALARPISFDLFTRETRIQDLIAILSGKSAAPGSAPRRGFLVPGLYGDDPGLAELRATLRDQIAFETLQLPDLASPMAVTSNMDATGAFLADQALASAADGPIVLAGYSFGAHAAVAAALALQAAGAGIDLLCLLDPLPGRLPPPANPPKRWSRLRKAEFALSGAGVFMVKRLASLGWIGAARKIALACASIGDVEDVQKRRRHVLQPLREQAATGWRPQPYRGRTILFATDDFERTGDPRPYLELLPDVRIVPVGGGHLQMFQGEALRTIADTLRGELAQISGGQPASMASSASRSGL